jgi:hypothetical protein
VYVVRHSPPTAVREWRTPFPQRRDFLYAVRERRTPESTAYAIERRTPFTILATEWRAPFVI